MLLDWMCVRKIHMLKPNPQWDGIWMEWLWGMIRSWGWSPQEVGLVPLWNKPQRAPSPLPPPEEAIIWLPIYELGSRSSTDTESAGALILDLLSPELKEENVYCLNHRVYGIFVAAAKQSSTTSIRG